MKREDFDTAYRTGTLRIDGTNFSYVGMWLMKKPNKTEEEMAAALAYRKLHYKFFWLVMLPFMFLLLWIVAFSLPDSFPDPFSYHGPADIEYSGTYHNGRIEFKTETDELKYISPEEIGMNSKKLRDGVKIDVFLDEKENLLGGEIDSFLLSLMRINNFDMIIFTYLTVSSPIFIGLWCGLGWLTSHRPFYRWKAKVNSGKYERR